MDDAESYAYGEQAAMPDAGRAGSPLLHGGASLRGRLPNQAGSPSAPTTRGLGMRTLVKALSALCLLAGLVVLAQTRFGAFDELLPESGCLAMPWRSEPGPGSRRISGWRRHGSRSYSKRLPRGDVEGEHGARGGDSDIGRQVEHDDDPDGFAEDTRTWKVSVDTRIDSFRLEMRMAGLSTPADLKRSVVDACLAELSLDQIPPSWLARQMDTMAVQFLDTDGAPMTMKELTPFTLVRRSRELRITVRETKSAKAAVRSAAAMAHAKWDHFAGQDPASSGGRHQIDFD